MYDAIAYFGNRTLALVLASAPAFPSTERSHNRIAQCIMTQMVDLMDNTSDLINSSTNYVSRCTKN